MKNLKRSVFCGQINQSYLDKEVVLAGWVNRRRDLGGLIFVDLRDRSGLMQLVFDPELSPDATAKAHEIRSEYVIAVKGTVIKRQGAINSKISTGEFELKVSDVQVFNESQTLPFQLDGTNVSEDLRLKYRYLDLRRPVMQNYLKMRHDIVYAMRDYLNRSDFYEIETPILSKSTPEGARDFLVPCRIQPGTFYALPQSPQLYKQLLIVGGLERYFQIARCFRDEALRANRQPEFTQLDIEMSFVDEQDIQNMCEGLFKELWKKFFGIDLQLPFPRYSYDEVFSKYGSDKPDTRFGLEINNLTEIFKNLEINPIKSVLNDGGQIGCVCVPGVGATSESSTSGSSTSGSSTGKKFSRSELDSYVELVTKELGGKALLWIRWKESGAVDSPIAKQLPENFFELAQKHIPGLTKSDTLFLVAGQFDSAWTILGQLRLVLGKNLNLINNATSCKNDFNLFWVVDFPMFEWSEEDNRWMAKHHPFTSPQQGWENMEIGKVKARAYDLVCNGEELGGGSIRIHDPKVQNKIFEMIGITSEQAKERFGFLLEAQTFGYPPDGGIAFGIDRLVMMFAGTDSIRDVIAFPKTQKGGCLMMETPSTVDQAQLDELHIKSTVKK
ncbi:MAG: aspartate--tRNA ligase [Candidatus Babeliales bacterium]|jgi:aspartyl-tRNA synthetase